MQTIELYSAKKKKTNSRCTQQLGPQNQFTFWKNSLLILRLGPAY